MDLLKLFKLLSITSFAFFPLSSIEADEYKFDNIKFDQVENVHNTYQPKDKLDQYIINGATYSTKFVPLMNDGAEGSEYTSIMANDLNRLLVDAGFNLQIQRQMVRYKKSHSLLRLCKYLWRDRIRY